MSTRPGTVDRTTNGTRNVVDLTLAELRELDAAYWFVPGEGTPHDRPEEDYVYRGIATGDRPPPPGYSTEDFVSHAHAVDMAVQVWTVNTCEEMLRMMALGVDAIMTDRPLLLEELLNTPPEERSCD